MKRVAAYIAFAVCFLLMYATMRWCGRSLLSWSTLQTAKTPVETTPTSASASQPSIPIGSHPLDAVLDLARTHSTAFEREVLDYVAVLTKEERVGGVLGEPQTMTLKFRCPQVQSDDSVSQAHVYLRFDEPNRVRGREVIWIDGQNNGQLIAHEGGWFNVTRVQLDPEGTLAMMGNKYPITQIGMGKLLRKLIEKGERDRQESDCQVTMREERLNDVACTLIEVVHPKAKSHLDFHIARIYLDESRHLPLRYESFLWPKDAGGDPPLEERYSYSDIRLNVGLTDQDFDPDNSEYKFP